MPNNFIHLTRERRRLPVFLPPSLVTQSPYFAPWRASDNWLYLRQCPEDLIYGNSRYRKIKEKFELLYEEGEIWRERIIVTDRKKEIAVIMPFGKETKEEKIFQLMQSGMAC